MREPPADAAEPGPRLALGPPLAASLGILGALLYQVAVYAPVLAFRAGADSFTEPILEFTDGFRALLPHLAITLMGLVGAFLAFRRRGLAAGLLLGAGTAALVTFAIAVRGAWWAATAGSLPIVAHVGLYLGLAGGVALFAGGVVALRGLVGGGRELPAVALASFFLGAWLIPWLAWGAADRPPSGLDAGVLGWLGRAMVATAFLALALALVGWILSPSPFRGRGMGTLAGLAIVLLVAGLVAGWSVVRILHAAAWGGVGLVLGLILLALVRALARPALPGALAVAGLGLLIAGLLLPVFSTADGSSFRPLAVGEVPVADLLANAVNELPPLLLVALGLVVMRRLDLSAGLLIAAAVVAIPWSLLSSVGSIEIGMWLRIAGLLLALAAAWLLLTTSERPGSEPPSPR